MLDAFDVDEVAEAIVTAKIAPIAAAGCAVKSTAGLNEVVAAQLATRAPWKVEHGGDVERLFDLASLTKPMTAVAVVRAGIDKATPLSALIPELASTASGAATMELLLSHRAGLEPHVALFAPLRDGGKVDPRAALRTAADARRGDARGTIPAGGFAPVYSDVGYLLAGEALARATGSRDAGEAIAKLVIEPLGLTAEMGTARELEAWGIDVVHEAAPTEDVPWRGGVVRGRVHDENAWALTGDGGSGHAGIFGTVRAVISFGCAVLDALESKTALLSIAPSGMDRDLGWLVALRPGGTLRAGFDGKSAEDSSAGTIAGPWTFGHLGFTGTSLWIDPEPRAVVSLLTNRVNPSRDHVAIRAARPRAHDALFARARSLAAGR
jgi:CubicO group peptidase (beta-lactamase class C family)